MSRDELHNIASNDTPNDITIPNTLLGLIIWAAARFGIGIIVAGVFALATKEIYFDMRSDRLQLLEAYKENALVIQGFSSNIEKLCDTIDEAHRRAEK